MQLQHPKGAGETFSSSGSSWQFHSTRYLQYTPIESQPNRQLGFICSFLVLRLSFIGQTLSPWLQSGRPAVAAAPRIDSARTCTTRAMIHQLEKRRETTFKPRLVSKSTLVYIMGSAILEDTIWPKLTSILAPKLRWSLAEAVW